MSCSFCFCCSVLLLYSCSATLADVWRTGGDHTCFCCVAPIWIALVAVVYSSTPVLMEGLFCLDFQIFFRSIFLCFHVFHFFSSKYWNAKRSKHFALLLNFQTLEMFPVFPAFPVFLEKKRKIWKKKLLDMNGPRNIPVFGKQIWKIRKY